MKTRYPVKLCEVLFPEGTEVRPATLEEMQTLWPGIRMRKGSPQVGVWFPGLPVPTVIHTSQLEGVTYPIATWNAPKERGPGSDARPPQPNSLTPTMKHNLPLPTSCYLNYA
jgi:hypothetical protein